MPCDACLQIVSGAWQSRDAATSIKALETGYVFEINLCAPYDVALLKRQNDPNSGGDKSFPHYYHRKAVNSAGAAPASPALLSRTHPIA